MARQYQPAITALHQGKRYTGTNSFTTVCYGAPAGHLGATQRFVGFSGATVARTPTASLNFIFTERCGGVAVTPPDYHWNSVNGNWTNNALDSNTGALEIIFYPRQCIYHRAGRHCAPHHRRPQQY